MSTTSSSSKPSNAFLATLQNLRNGCVADDLSQALTDLVAAVKEAGKTGTITFKLKVSPASVGDVSKLLITDAISTNLPQKVKPATLFFPSEDNLLLRDDPNQRELNLHAVPETPKPELRETPAPAPVPLRSVAN